MIMDWSQLPPELIEIISKGLTIYSDYLYSRAVCHAWRFSIPKTPNHLPPQLPWLMLPQSQSQSNQSRRAFFSLSTNKFHFLNLPEVSYRKRHCGSSHGWLMILDDTPTILLINPLTRAKLSLPPLSSFPNVISFNYSDIGREYALRNLLGERVTVSLRQMRDSFIRKVVLSSSPLKDNNFVVIAILNQTDDLAYCRNGDKSWSLVENARSFCEDVIFVNGMFYAVNKAGQIVICDISSDSPRVSFMETPRQAGGDMQYLVNSGDELLLVTRYLDLEYEFDHPDMEPHLIYRTIRFEVFRLDWNGPQWLRMSTLGDKALFIGENSSLSLSATDFSGCMGNCIYYTDDYLDANYDGHFGDHDLGIFKLCDETIEPLPCYPRNFTSPLQWSPPLWVSPNPC
ncbi:ubiquitin-protein ligase, putative [Ricinus communis]|uniref:Ubiquitin-protein ligase, putative n=1 Tax=Ricinus communis TaxID=3988 RepID=B9R8H5_RICCO|nr:ubiquitin-protein ligase, putative [Ricinus communis]|eukprot:XP_002510618.1 F-box protein SKIP23 [Ricinus communis]